MSEINFCTEHAGRTCCTQDDVNKVKGKLGLAKMKCDVSDICFSMTTKVLCSYCDGDIVRHHFEVIRYRVQEDPKAFASHCVISGITHAKVTSWILM